VVAQARINIENLDSVLAELGAARADVCRVNTFYLGYGTATDWARAGAIRGNAFAWPGPVGTGVPVSALFPKGVTQRQEAVAMLGLDGSRLPRVALRPEGHWDWPIPVNFQQVVKVGRMVFVGGQVSAKGTGDVLYPNDLEAQTHEVMRDIERSLEVVGAKLDDVVKLNTFYKGGADLDYPRRCAAIHSSYFRDPGPTTTGVPLPKIAIEGLELEIEAYAMVDG
jgi:enamine deaminase RidA (YjgF/YER057c/UK114 family)